MTVIRAAPLAHAIVMVASLVVGVGLGVWLFGASASYYKGQAEMWQQRATTAPESNSAGSKEASPSTAFPTAQVVGVLEYASGIPITFGVPLNINLGILNKGPGLARNVRFMPEIAIGRYFTDPEVIQAIDARYKQMELRVREDEYQDIPSESKQWTTLTWELSEDEVQRILSRELFLYAHLRYEWEDSAGAHYGESCRFLNSPQLVGPTKEVQFAYCRGHNRIK